MLSLYKDDEEAELQLSITLSDVTAVALTKPPKSKREHIFGVYSPSKNYRFEAESDTDAKEWVKYIQNELSPDTIDSVPVGDRSNAPHKDEDDADSASELSEHEEISTIRQSHFLRTRAANRRARNSSRIQDYSGNDITSCSDFSDVPGPITPQQSTGSLARYEQQSLSPPAPSSNNRPSMGTRNISQQSDPTPTSVDLERVIFQGYLLCLKSKKGVRQWKKLWAVLRPQSISFYKDEKEYSAVKIISMSHVINAAEIDPVSRSKKFCLQIIAEEKTYRFCAPNEEDLAKWLGALKSVLVKRGGLPRATSGPLSPK